MDTNEILARTLNAAKEARNRGFYKTADAFDEIVETLLDLLDAEQRSRSAKRANSASELQHFH